MTASEGPKPNRTKQQTKKGQDHQDLKTKWHCWGHSIASLHHFSNLERRVCRPVRPARCKQSEVDLARGRFGSFCLSEQLAFNLKYTLHACFLGCSPHRAHSASSDWLRYNRQRQLAGLPLLSEAEFEQKIETGSGVSAIAHSPCLHEDKHCPPTGYVASLPLVLCHAGIQHFWI